MKIYPDDWPFRLTTGVTTAVCIVAAMMLEPVIGIHGLWPHMITIVIAVILANVIGRLVYRILFPRPSGDLPDHQPRP